MSLEGNNVMTGMIIAIEGINGSGKSSIINELTKYCDLNKLFKYKVYKFPDRQGYYGNQIDKFLRKEYQFEYKYDMFNAFAANRLAICNQILQDVNDGIIVICDRYIFSGIAYHIPLDANDFVIQNYKNVIGYFDKDMPSPDITFLIDGNHLHLRNENKQRYHYDNYKANMLFNIFKKIIMTAEQSPSNIIIKNEYGYINETVKFMFNKIINLLTRER